MLLLLLLQSGLRFGTRAAGVSCKKTMSDARKREAAIRTSKDATTEETSRDLVWASSPRALYNAFSSTSCIERTLLSVKRPVTSHSRATCAQHGVEVYFLQQFNLQAKEDEAQVHTVFILARSRSSRVLARLETANSSCDPMHKLS